MAALFIILTLYLAQDPSLQEHLQAQQAYLANPRSEDRLVALVSILYREDENKKAIDLLQAFVGANPKASRAKLFLALGYAQEELYDEARSLAEQVAAEIPNDYYAQHVIALSLFGLHRFDEAEVRFKRALELKPDFAESYFELGLLYMGKPETFEQARASFQRALEYSYPQPEVYKNLASINIKLGRYGEAIDQLNAALKLDPNYAEAYYQLATALRNSGSADKSAEAMKRFEVLIKAALDKKQHAAKSHDLYEQGMSLLAKDDFANAYNLFRSAADMLPQLDTTHYRMAQIDYLHGDLARALQGIRRALDLNPFEPEYYFVLSRCLEHSDVPGAIEAVTKAVSLNPGVGDFHNLLGTLLERTGDFPGAVQSYVRATELEPQNETFRANLSAAQQKLAKKK